ncbi:hypothetical protein D3C85_1787210 [compost metagenome]
MSTDNPIFMNDHGSHHYAVHCQQHGRGESPWTVYVEIFRDEDLVLPRRSLDDQAFRSYEDAREAGAAIAEQLINQLEGLPR